MIGGKGKRILTFAGRHAQIVSLLATATPGGDSLAFFEEQLGWVNGGGEGPRRPHARHPHPVRRGGGPGESSLTVAERFAGGRPGVTAQDVLDSPFVLVGEMAAIKDQLVEIQERYGIDYVTLSEGFAYAIAPVVEELSALTATTDRPRRDRGGRQHGNVRRQGRHRHRGRSRPRS